MNRTPSKPHYAWTINSARDLLEKAKRDLGRFRASHEADDGEQVDHAINCAITLWHIHDWLWREYESRWKAQGVEHKGMLQDWLHEKDGRGRLMLCERLANGSKHFALDKPANIDLTTYISATDVPDGMARASMERLAAGEQFVSYSLGLANARDVLKVSTTDGKDIRVDNLFDATIDFWEQLLKDQTPGDGPAQERAAAPATDGQTR
jgi:hypothetical protein